MKSGASSVTQCELQDTSIIGISNAHCGLGLARGRARLRVVIRKQPPPGPSLPAGALGRSAYPPPRGQYDGLKIGTVGCWASCPAPARVYVPRTPLSAVRRLARRAVLRRVAGAQRSGRLGRQTLAPVELPMTLATESAHTQPTTVLSRPAVRLTPRRAPASNRCTGYGARFSHP